MILPLVSARDAAQLLGVREATLAMWRARQVGPPFTRLPGNDRRKGARLETGYRDGTIRYAIVDLEKFVMDRLIQTKGLPRPRAGRPRKPRPPLE